MQLQFNNDTWKRSRVYEWKSRYLEKNGKSNVESHVWCEVDGQKKHQRLDG